MPEIINYHKLDDVDHHLISLANYFVSEYKTNVVVNSGGRSYEHQVQIYKDKFGSNWEKEMPKDSAHVFKPGEKAQAIDFYVQYMFITKVHNVLLDLADTYELKGIGIDIFKNYCHVDRKDRGRKDVLLWAYDPEGRIHYLNA